MPLNREEIVVRGLTPRPMREIKRWMEHDLDGAEIADALFVKAVLERQRANWGHLLEFGGIGFAAVVAINIAMVQIVTSVESVWLGWSFSAVLLIMIAVSVVIGMAVDDRLDRIENRLTQPPALAAAEQIEIEQVAIAEQPGLVVELRSVAHIGPWHLVREEWSRPGQVCLAPKGGRSDGQPSRGATMTSLAR